MGKLFFADVFVVALAGLIVITNHALPIDDKREAIFEGMSASAKRRRNTPDHHLGKRVLANDVAFVQ